MLRSTFCHIPGIGEAKERLLWEAGIRTWEGFLEGSACPLPEGEAAAVRRHIELSCERCGDPLYFADVLPSGELWRLLPEFRDRTAYIDIETTGLDRVHDEITTIALYDGERLQCFVNGRNLDEFPSVIARYPVIVTYNGKSFDIPFIERFFRIDVRAAHVDLRYVLASLGYRGGLKKIEKAFGIDREELEGVDGWFAVRLWQEYRMRGSEAALETLLAYNAEDTVNLEILAARACNLKTCGYRFLDLPKLVPGPAPEIPYRADTALIARLVGEGSGAREYR